MSVDLKRCLSFLFVAFGLVVVLAAVPAFAQSLPKEPHRQLF